MIPNQDTTTLLIPARRRTTSAVPVLIRVPDLAAPRAPRRRARRRRLRREVRVAGSVLLALIPMALMFASLGGRLPTLSPSGLGSEADSGPRVALAPIREVPAVSLSLEPVGSAAREPEAPVILPGILWPADSSEEDGDGRR